MKWEIFSVHAGAHTCARTRAHTHRERHAHTEMRRHHRSPIASSYTVLMSSLANSSISWWYLVQTIQKSIPFHFFVDCFTFWTWFDFISFFFSHHLHTHAPNTHRYANHTNKTQTRQKPLGQRWHFFLFSPMSIVLHQVLWYYWQPGICWSANELVTNSIVFICWFIVVVVVAFRLSVPLFFVLISTSFCYCTTKMYCNSILSNKEKRNSNQKLKTQCRFINFSFRFRWNKFFDEDILAFMLLMADNRIAMISHRKFDSNCFDLYNQVIWIKKRLREIKPLTHGKVSI